MTPFPYSVDVDDPLERAHQLMRTRNIRHLPVTLGGEIVGMLTDRGIKLVLGPDFAYPREDELKVRDAYVEQPCIVSASTPVASVAQTMADRRIGSAIVVKANKLVGIFTVTGACRALAEVLKIPDSESDDAASRPHHESRSTSLRRRASSGWPAGSHVDFGSGKKGAASWTCRFRKSRVHSLSLTSTSPGCCARSSNKVAGIDRCRTKRDDRRITLCPRALKR